MENDDIILSVGVDLENAKTDLRKFARLVEQLDMVNGKLDAGFSIPERKTYAKQLLKSIDDADKYQRKLKQQSTKDALAANKRIEKEILAAKERTAISANRFSAKERDKELRKIKQAILERSKLEERENKRLAALRHKQAEREYAYHVKKIKEEAKIKEREFARSAAGALSREHGTTFGHKFVTTAEYLAAYKAQQLLTQGLADLIAMSVKYDNALYQSMAVLDLNNEEAAKLASANYGIAISYGAVVEEIQKASLTLGRAGVSYSNLAEATKVTTQLARITGDTLDDSAKVVSTFTVAFGLASEEVHALGSELAYTANASKLSIEDLGTMANYALSGAKALGLTKEAVLAFSAAFSNIGVNASTIGTQMRKFGKLLREESKASKQFFSVLEEISKKAGDKVIQTQSHVAHTLRKGGEESNQEFIKLAENVSKMSDEAYESAVSGLPILTKQLLDSLRLTSGSLKEHLENLKKSGDMLEAQSRIQALSIEGMWNSAIASIDKAASTFATKMANFFTNRDEIQRQVEVLKNLKQGTEAYNIALADLNKLLGEKRDIESTFKPADTIEGLKKQIDVENKIKKLSKERLEQYIKLKDTFEKANKTYLESSFVSGTAQADKAKEKLEEYNKHIDAYNNKLKKSRRHIEELTKAYKKLNDKKFFGTDGNEIISAKTIERIEKLRLQLKLLKDDIPENKLATLRKELENITSKENLKTDDVIKKLQLQIKIQSELNRLKHEQINLHKKLETLITKSETKSPEYDALVAKYENFTKLAKGNKENLLLIDKWYQQELSNLNDKEIADFEKREDKKLQLAAEAKKREIELKYTKLDTPDLAKSDSLELEKEKMEEILAIEESEKDKQADLVRLEEAKQAIRANRLAEEKEYKDLMSDSYTSMIDYQIELAESAMDWGNNLEGVAGKIANVSKTINQVYVASLKGKKNEAKIDKKYTKEFEKYGKKKILTIEEQNEVTNLGNKQAQEIAANKQAILSAEIAGYSSLAGAMGNMFEEGSKGAKAFGVIQATLGIINAYTAITNAMATPPAPVGIALGALVAGQVAPIIGTLASLGGSGGSGGGASAEAGYQSQIKQNKADIELSYEPITNRLDQQIALLDAINRQGSSAALKTNSAALSFERDYALWKQDVFSGSLLAPQPSYLDREGWDNVDTWENSLGFNVFDRVGDYYTSNVWDGYGGYDDSREPTLHYGNEIQLDTNSLVEDDRLLDVLTNLINSKAYAGTLGQNAVGNEGDQSDQLAWLDKMVSELQGKINDWALSSIDTMNNLSDAADDFKDAFDSLTDSTYYADRKLKDSFEQIDKLRGDSTLPDYLSDLVYSIQSTNEFLTDDRFNLLLSKNPEDIEAQTDLLKEFGEVTGHVFKKGAKEALDYIDSIKAVSEAMAQSKQNQKDFIDSFKTDEQLTADKARKLEVSVATTTNELVSLFSTLSGGIGGLTDKELDFLTANKDLIGSFDDIIAKYDESIDTLASVIDSVQSTLDKLYGSVLGSSYTMQQYYDAMSRAMRADLTDAKAYQDLVNDAISKSSVLFDVNNYQTIKDQQFAQLMAAKQFESIQDVSVTQIDYLKYIEANTRESNAHLIAMLQALSDDINKQYTASNAIVVDTAYNEVLGRDAEAAGANYWSNQLSSGNITADNLNSTIAQSAIAYSGDGSSTGVTQSVINESKSNAIDYLANTATPQATSSTDALVHGIYQKYDLDQYQTDDSGYNYWNTQIKTGALSVSDLEATIKKAAEENLNHKVVAKFAEGGIVTAPTLGLIGEAGYNEAVIPLKDSNDPLQTKELVSAIKDLTAIVLQQAEDGRESRKLSEDQLLTLLDIEEKIT